MKRMVITLAVVSLAYVSLIILRADRRTPAVNAAEVQAAANTEYQSPIPTPTWIPTETPVPTATIGYEATLMIAQATADEARRVNIQVTSDAEQRQLSYAQLTAVENDHVYQVQSWTATAALTAIPATATQQAVSNTQIAGQQTLVAGLMTGTAQAPTQYAAMLETQSRAQYDWLDKLVWAVFGIGMGIGALGIGVFMFRWKPPVAKDPEESPTETVVHIRQDRGQGDFTQVRLVVPCAPEQLTELAEMAVNGEKKFGINRLETQSRTLRGQRDTLMAFRQFLIDNNFVISDVTGITLNDAGEAFLTGWFDTHKLSDEYEFEPKRIQLEPELA